MKYKRQITKDWLINCLVGRMVRKGFKAGSVKALFKLIAISKQIDNSDFGLRSIEKTFQRVSPSIWTRLYKIAGTNVRIPYVVPSKHRLNLAARWFSTSSLKRPEFKYFERYIKEFQALCDFKGETIRMYNNARVETIKNKTNLRFRIGKRKRRKSKASL